MADILNVGDTAPDFTLTNQDGRKISLEQFKGKWVVLYFYPRALTPGCTAQAKSLRDHMADIKKLGAVVLGVSPDKTESLKKFEKRDELNFPLLGDPEHTMAEDYGAWQEKSMYGRLFMGFQRMTYIIDPEGKIAHVIPKAKPKTHTEDVINFLKDKVN